MNHVDGHRVGIALHGAALAGAEPHQEQQGHLALGVIGHVDHGKTSLVRAISGMETDRLEEERRRGMSIVLGFAWLAFEEGIVDIIDVPGHEQFVRTMVAGATGIDAVLLVVDAREGVKPQTVEHLAIAGLLGVRQGLIAITKCDLVAADERRAMLERLRAFLAGSFLQDAPVTYTSVLTGEGVREIEAALRRMVAAQTRRTIAAGRCYLPVDRVFSLHGSGTVVTGTLRAGQLSVGDELELLPSGRRTSVRQLQCHNQPVDRVLPGQRVGVNLRHLDSADIHRGDVLAPAGLLRASVLFNVEIVPAPGATGSLSDGQTVRLLIGTSDVAAKVRLLAPATANADACVVAQLRTRRPVVATLHEPFILRSDSPPGTLAGGRVLDPAATWLRRSDRAGLERLHIVARGGSLDILLERLKAAGHRGMLLTEIAGALGAIGLGTTDIDVIRLVDDKLAVYQPLLGELACRLRKALERYHAQSPWEAGAQLSWCRTQLPRDMAPAVFKALLKDMAAGGRIAVADGLARVPRHDPLAALPVPDRRLALDIEASLRDGGMSPPDVGELVEGRRATALLRMLVDLRRCVLLEGQLPGQRIAFHRSAVQWAQERLAKAYPRPAQFTVSDARQAWCTSRKFAVPVLAHLDRIGYTQRKGDLRTLSPAAASASQFSSEA
ncbi:MAG: selenocysteine-specific translation elongation factor [Burkholderiaceae bacterium]